MKKNIVLFLSQNLNLFNSFDEIYLFGSIITKTESPNDIDILLLYTKYSNKLITDIDIIINEFENQFDLPVDLTVLSIDEEKDVNFLFRLNSNYFKLK